MGLYTTTLRAARLLARQYVPSAQSPAAYTDLTLDTAIQLACEEAIRYATILPRVDAVTLTSGDDALPTAPTNFRPDRLLEAYLSGSNVVVSPGYLDPNAPYYTVGAPMYVPGNPPTAKLLQVDYQVYIDNNASAPCSSQPQSIAFKSWATTGSTGNTGVTGNVYPKPDQNYTLNYRWLDFFTQWYPGTQGAWASTTTYYTGDIVSSSGTLYQALNNTAANLNKTPASNLGTFWVSLGTGTTSDPTTLTFNLPDDMLTNIIAFGVRARLQMNIPEVGYGVGARKEFTEYLDSIRGKGNMGAQVVVMASRGD